MLFFFFFYCMLSSALMCVRCVYEQCKVLSNSKFLEIREDVSALYVVITFHATRFIISAVIRQTGKSQNECYKKIKYAKFSENKQGVKNVILSKNFSVLCFFVTPVLTLALSPYYQQYTKEMSIKASRCQYFLGILPYTILRRYKATSQSRVAKNL